MSQLKGRGDQTKETLEYTSEYNDDTILSDFLDSVNFINSIGKRYNKIRHILDFKNCSSQLIQKVFDEYPDLPEEEFVAHDILGTPTWLSQFSLPKGKGWRVFVTIKDLADIGILQQFTIPIDAIVMRLTKDNVSDLLQGYRILQKTSITPIDLFNIKIDEKSFILTPENRKIIENFFSAVIADNYYFDNKTQQVYNKEVRLPIKGIRSLKKWMFKYSYSSGWFNVIEREPNHIYRQYDNTTKLTRQEFADMKLKSPDELMIVSGYKCDKCPKCELKGACSTFSSNPANIPEKTYCTQAIFAKLLFDLVLKDKPSEEKMQHFMNGANRNLA